MSDNTVYLINDHERGLLADYEEWLEELAPHGPISPYFHDRTGEDTGDAHLKRQIMGRRMVVAPANGRFDCSPWEQTSHWEFGDRRGKRVLIKISRE